METKEMFKWVVESSDNAYYEESKPFATKAECYNDMRQSALNKMKWNTEYDEDFEGFNEKEFIHYDVKFSKDTIVHDSYSGTYTYTIVPCDIKMSFPVVELRRDTLARMGYKHVMSISDEQMERVAKRLNNYFMEDSFWEYMERAIDDEFGCGGLEREVNHYL